MKGSLRSAVLAQSKEIDTVVSGWHALYENGLASLRAFQKVLPTVTSRSSSSSSTSAANDGGEGTNTIRADPVSNGPFGSLVGSLDNSSGRLAITKADAAITNLRDLAQPLNSIVSKSNSTLATIEETLAPHLDEASKVAELEPSILQIVDFYRKVLSEIEYVINVFLRILSQINYDIESDLLSKYIAIWEGQLGIRDMGIFSDYLPYKLFSDKLAVMGLIYKETS